MSVTFCDVDKVFRLDVENRFCPFLSSWKADKAYTESRTLWNSSRCSTFMDVWPRIWEKVEGKKKKTQEKVKELSLMPEKVLWKQTVLSDFSNQKKLQYQEDSFKPYKTNYQVLGMDTVVKKGAPFHPQYSRGNSRNARNSTVGSKWK